MSEQGQEAQTASDSEAAKARRWRELAQQCEMLIDRIYHRRHGELVVGVCYVCNWLADYDAALTDSPVSESKEHRYRDALEVISSIHDSNPRESGPSLLMAEIASAALADEGVKDLSA